MLVLGLDILVDSLYETLSLIPYLYLAYLLMEYLEQLASGKTLRHIRKAGKFGPIIGGFLGLFPQCGFSVAGANLYTTGIITLGTLMAIFLSTSDEMLPLLVGSSSITTQTIFLILFLKLFFAITAGFLIDMFLPNSFIAKKTEPNIKAFCLRERCQCDDNDGNMWISAFKHTQKISIFIFLFSLIINTIFSLGGDESIQSLLTNMPILSKVLASFFGLIPSCYQSVLFTQLYLDSTISLGTLMSGTLSNAGVGFLVLYKTNPNEKENLRILSLLFGLSIIFGILTDIIF